VTVTDPVDVRWLGRVAYGEAWDLQQRLFEGTSNHLLLLEHPPTYTLGRRTKPEHLLVDPETIGASVHEVNRGGDVTFHGPGQLVGYPIIDVAGRRGGGMADTRAYVCSVEQAIIDALAELGLDASRLAGEPGVWLDPDGDRARKIAAIGVRLSRGRSMHGFAINNTVDLSWFGHIVPCGIVDKGVTSISAEGIDVTTETLVEIVTRNMAKHLVPDRPVATSHIVFREDISDLSAFSRGQGPGEAIRPERGKSAPMTETAGRAGVPVQLGRRLDQAGITEGLDVSARKPEWMRVKLRTDPDYLRLKTISRELDLVTVCEEAGCPNIFECWNEGTATFMLLGERCTRACGFCLIDTRKPEPPDPAEPGRIAEAVVRLDLDFAVLTMVARDDLDDGGAGHVAATVRAISDVAPSAGIEVLISDLRGDAAALQVVLDSGPTIVNHNIETVARLQRAVRPSAGYGRSLTLLARSVSAGRTTKSGIIVGMGETFDEVVATLRDLAAVGVEIVTIGQYLRPTTHHLPVHRWWTPDEFARLKEIGENELGIAHVESSPLTRSSHHAGSAAVAAGVH
jgi:lipoic acid synthetase